MYLNTIKEGEEMVRVILISLSILFVMLMLVFPILAIFKRALVDGIAIYWDNIASGDTLFAMGLTIFVAVMVLPINLIFGISASWLIAKHKVIGKRWLMTIIELPLSISPIIAGLAYLMVFGNYGFIGKYLEPIGLRLTFNVLGVILVTVFVSMAYIVSVLVPLMEKQGNSQEEVALTLGASHWKTFWLVTLPNIKWGLLYGLILSNARAIGEFGAVSVVSGMIRGETLTLPLQVQVMYFDYNVTGAFAASTVLVILAMITLFLRHILSKKETKY